MIEDILFGYPYHLHIGVIIIALLIWLFRNVPKNGIKTSADIVSFLSVFVMYFLYYTYNIRPGKFSSPEGWYIFYSILTTGLLPLFTLLSAWFFGRGIGRLLRTFKNKFS